MWELPVCPMVAIFPSLSYSSAVVILMSVSPASIGLGSSLGSVLTVIALAEPNFTPAAEALKTAVVSVPGTSFSLSTESWPVTSDSPFGITSCDGYVMPASAIVFASSGAMAMVTSAGTGTLEVTLSSASVSEVALAVNVNWTGVPFGFSSSFSFGFSQDANAKAAMAATNRYFAMFLMVILIKLLWSMVVLPTNISIICELCSDFVPICFEILFR